MLVLFLYNYRLTTVTSCFIVDIEISTIERGKKGITRMVIMIMTKTAKVASAWKVNVVLASIGISILSGIGSFITSG